MTHTIASVSDRTAPDDLETMRALLRARRWRPLSPAHDPHALTAQRHVTTASPHCMARTSRQLVVRHEPAPGTQSTLRPTLDPRPTPHQVRHTRNVNARTDKNDAPGPLPSLRDASARSETPTSWPHCGPMANVPAGQHHARGFSIRTTSRERP